MWTLPNIHSENKLIILLYERYSSKQVFSRTGPHRPVVRSVNWFWSTGLAGREQQVCREIQRSSRWWILQGGNHFQYSKSGALVSFPCDKPLVLDYYSMIHKKSRSSCQHWISIQRVEFQLLSIEWKECLKAKNIHRKRLQQPLRFVATIIPF